MSDIIHGCQRLLILIKITLWDIKSLPMLHNEKELKNREVQLLAQHQTAIKWGSQNVNSSSVSMPWSWNTQHCPLENRACSEHLKGHYVSPHLRSTGLQRKRRNKWSVRPGTGDSKVLLSQRWCGVWGTPDMVSLGIINSRYCSQMERERYRMAMHQVIFLFSLRKNIYNKHLK